MNGDIRIHVNFLRHHKTRRLRRSLGADGVLSLLALWVFTAESRPSGVLAGLDAADLEEVADWTGEPGAFIDALIANGFLELENGLCRVHDWVENNPWAAGAEQRSAKARKAAEERWKRSAEIERECSEHAPSMQVACDPLCPSPLLTSPQKDASQPSVPPCPHDEIISIYEEILPELPKVARKRWRGSARAKNLDLRWKEDEKHRDIRFWRWFFESVRLKSWWLGENDRGWRADLGWLLQRSNFDKAIEHAMDQRGRGV